MIQQHFQIAGARGVIVNTRLSSTSDSGGSRSEPSPDERENHLPFAITAVIFAALRLAMLLSLYTPYHASRRRSTTA